LAERLSFEAVGKQPIRHCEGQVACGGDTENASPGWLHVRCFGDLECGEVSDTKSSPRAECALEEMVVRFMVNWSLSEVMTSTLRMASADQLLL
jgi:hypothetical protein